MAYIDNAAYDLSVYDPQKEQQREESVELRVVNRKNVAQIAPIKTIFMIALALSVTITLIYSKVELAEISDEVTSRKSDLAKLSEEKKVLEMRLENEMTIQNIEKEAEALGMVKISKDRIKYIEVESDDTVEDTIESEEGSGTVLDRIKGIISRIMEYIGL
ncbi:MAG: hypothetical protein J5874_03830 [Oscillospiraceae bacterium]|nr:hypothetical protein [Oscillospiraceae bacterium]